jgi:hypothetical protein
VIKLDIAERQGAAGFERIFSLEPKAFSVDLQSIAKAPSQKIAALMAGQRTREIARLTLNAYGLYTSIEQGLQESKKILLERYLQDRDRIEPPQTDISPRDADSGRGIDSFYR